MRVYCVQFIIKEVNSWKSDISPFEFVRFETSYYLNTSLFSASDADTAYSKALDWSDCFGDANHDGPGDLTEYSCVGIHELEDLVALDDLHQELAERYGVDVGNSWGEKDAPLARRRDQLGIFRVLRKV